MAVRCDRRLSPSLLRARARRPLPARNVLLDEWHAPQEPGDAFSKLPVIRIVGAGERLRDVRPTLRRLGTAAIAPLPLLERDAGLPEAPFLPGPDAPERIEVASHTPRSLPRRFGFDAPAPQLLREGFPPSVQVGLARIQTLARCRLRPDA